MGPHAAQDHRRQHQRQGDGRPLGDQRRELGPLAGLDHRLGGGRILYVDRVHLPTLLANSRGVVNINSSVGISGLVHHVPVITLGRLLPVPLIAETPVRTRFSM